MWLPSSAAIHRLPDHPRGALRLSHLCGMGQKVIDPGYCFRQQHELLLLAARGSPPAPAPSDPVASVIQSRRGTHPEKPQIIHEMIERM